MPTSTTNARARAIGYWTTTGIIALVFGPGAIPDLLQFPDAVAFVAPLGYPAYLLTLLGTWKILGALALLVPRFPRLNEWAYAGILFDLTGAAASCAAVGVYGAYGFHVIAPLIITGFCVASWALRPPSRTLGVLFPARDGSAGVDTRAANIG